MYVLRKFDLVVGVFSITAMPSFAAEPAPLTGEMQTAHYRLDLQIGPMEQMFMQAEVAAKHPTVGEVMVGGSMVMPKDMATGHHLEVHVYSLEKAALVTDADVAIAVTDAAKKVQQIPAAKMYGIPEGPSDTHYGNNVSLPPGAYTIDVTVNGEKAAFTVTIPSA